MRLEGGVVRARRIRWAAFFDSIAFKEEGQVFEFRPALSTACAGTSPPSRERTRAPAAPIDHVVVIYLENRSFDHLYGLFPGAEGLALAGAAATQVDKDGKPYAMLPPFTGPPTNPAKPALQLPPFPPSRSTCCRSPQSISR